MAAESSDFRLRRPRSLCKQHSWSPDIHRDEAWANRRRNHLLRRGRGRSVTDDDLEELRGCVDLGFLFGSPDLDPKLSSTFPALELYLAVNRQFDAHSRSTSFSGCDSAGPPSSSSVESPTSIVVDTGDNPETVKARLRQWAQIVACSVRQFSPLTTQINDRD